MAEQLGFSPHTWVDCVVKRMIDSISGRGGTEALCTFFDQIDWIPELMPLTQNIKITSIFFETALAKCNKELLKRPVQVREGEVFECLISGGLNVKQYAELIRKLVKSGIVDYTPEVLLMIVAYDRLAEAYSSAYLGFKLVIDKTAEQFGWGNFTIHQAQVRDYMDRYFLGYLAGEQKIPREEKQILQFLVRGNLAQVDVAEATKLIRLGVEVVKWGFIYEVLGATGAINLYDKARAEYGELYNVLNGKIRLSNVETFGEQHRQKIVVKATQGGYYPPCLIMPSGSWEAGAITQDITLEPVTRLPVFPRADLGALQAVYGPVGSGKTLLLSAIACYAILSKHELVFSPLNDKSNSFTLASLPVFAFNKRTAKLLSFLKETLGVEPQGVPTLTLTFLRRGETVPDCDAHPPTIYDRVVVVDNPKGFDLDFKMIVDELKRIAESYGYSKSVGLINVRNLDRFDGASNVNIDIQVASSLLFHFDTWRKSHLSDPARITIDEISYLAPSTLSLYASDALRSGSSISDFIKESRRNRVSIEVGTQLPLEIIGEIRTGSTNVFFRDLATSKDRSKSQIEFLLESLQVEDPSVRAVVRDMNNRGSLPKYFWFWFNRESRKIRIIRPCPPTFAIQDIRCTPKTIFKLYEKTTGLKVLLDSWKQVPVLSTAKTTTKKLGSEEVFRA